jgi:hypothetical protein
MTKSELKDRIKGLALAVIRDTKKVNQKVTEYDELTKFPELRNVIVSLLTPDFDVFLSSIDWVSPRPTTFRINLKNNQEFYLIYDGRSWVAQVEGKKYYLLNISEEQRAAEAISRILRYGTAEGDEEEGGVDTSSEEVGGEEDVDVEVEDDVDVDIEI